MTLPADTMNAANNMVIDLATGWWMVDDSDRLATQHVEHVRSALSAVAFAWLGAVVLASAGIDVGRFGAVTAALATVAALGAPAVAAATAAAGVAVFANAFRSVYELARVAGAGAETSSRVVATVHAVAATAAAAAFLVGGGLSAPSVWWAAGRVAWSLGYLAHDIDLLLGELRTTSELRTTNTRGTTSKQAAGELAAGSPAAGELAGVDWATVAHHVAFAGALAVAAPRAAVLTARALLAEAAVPPLYLGWWMVRSGGDRRHPYVFAAAGVVTLVMFALTRVVNFALILPAVATSAGTIAGIGGAALLSLNVWWTWRLAARVAAAMSKNNNPAPATVVDESATAVDKSATAVVKPRRLRARAD